jgi:outer membrane protein assembly factor BamB
MKRTAIYSAMALEILSVAVFTGADWPRFLGPNGDSTTADKGLPDDWSATSNIVWKTELPGFGSSSPITVGDKIYLTTYTGYGLGKGDTGKPEDLIRHLVCIERPSGTIRWDKLARAALPEQEYPKSQINLHGYASSTPLSDGRAIYVFYGRSGVYAYGLTGDELWHRDVGAKTHAWGSSNSPILVGDLLIINACVESGSLIALNKKTGEPEWQVKGMKQSWSTPGLLKTADGKQELVVSIQGKVLGVDPATGEELWTCEGIDDYTCPTVITHGDVAYVSGARKSATLAVRGGGRGDVTKTHKLWETNKGSLVPTPVYSDGLLYMVNQTGTAICLKADTGELVYEQHVSGMKTVYASPLLADGKLYTVSRETGAVVWAVGPEFKEISRPILDDKSIFDASPVPSNGQMLLRSDKFLYCIGK